VPNPKSTLLPYLWHKVLTYQKNGVIVIRGEWGHKLGGYQFNAFGFMPFHGPITDWSIEVNFNNPISHIQVWTATAEMVDDRGHNWRFSANEHNAVQSCKIAYPSVSSENFFYH